MNNNWRWPWHNAAPLVVFSHGNCRIHPANITRFVPRFVTLPNRAKEIDPAVQFKKMNTDIKAYNEKHDSTDKEICNRLAVAIDRELPEAESKIWHAHPVWFLAGNPIAGYSKQKFGIRLMFWSGADFDEEELCVRGSKFKDASIFYNNVSEIKTNDLIRWLGKSRELQWDYKNIVKRKGQLQRLK